MNAFDVIAKLKQLKDLGIEVVFSSEIAEDKITVHLKNGFPKGVYIPLSVVPKIVGVFKEEIKKEK